MSDKTKWWFAPAKHGEIKGENTGDKEIFKKDTYVSLAREILQNSIDARDSDEEPVEIEFKEFSIHKDDIPDLDSYVSQIKRCVSFWKTKDDIRTVYEGILKYLEDNDTIKCLRISDYNTSGLTGIESKDSTADNSYNALVKGTGVSKKKTDFAGGSKGVGKNVPFLLSKLMMVFYVTKTTDNYYGSVGVTKLASGYVDDNDADTKRDYTQGTGYYAYSEFISPITEYLNFEKGYNNRENRCGTDIYIIGFESIDSWMKDVINSTLESFMVSVYRDELHVSFNDLEISKETLENLVNSDYIDLKYKKNIVAQYQILKNPNNNVKLYDIETDLGNVQMFILPYKKSEESDATRKCAMIRCPYMLIKYFDLNFNVSAMIIIGKDTLGKMLRSIENPQHKDWEPKRIKDSSERAEVTNALAVLKEQMRQNVLDCLQLGDDSPIDPNGAGEFLSDESFGEEKAKKNENKDLDAKDNAEVGVVRTINFREHNANIKDDDGHGEEPNIGEIVDEEGDENSPSGHNETSGGEARSGDKPGEKEPGDNEIIVRAWLTGVKYNVISTNKKEGRLKIIFIAPESYEKCYLNLSLLDDANNSTKLEIQELLVGGKRLEYEDKIEPGAFSIEKNTKTVLEVKVDKDDYFACEVKVKYESR